MSSFVVLTMLMMMVTNNKAYNDLCIRESGSDDIDQRYLFDLSVDDPYGEFNLVWKGVKQKQYWFWLAKFNGSYEWTIDNAKHEVARYCRLTDKEQKQILNGEISYIYPFSCNEWNKHYPKTKQSEPLPQMDIFDCDIYSVDELLEYLVYSTGRSATISDEGKIVIDTNTNANADSAASPAWDLRYIDLVYILLFTVIAYFLFKRERTNKRTRLYRPVNTDNE